MSKTDSFFNPDQYATVAERIELFYSRFPQGRINTELVTREDGEITFKALVYRGVDAALALLAIDGDEVVTVDRDDIGIGTMLPLFDGASSRAFTGTRASLNHFGATVNFIFTGLDHGVESGGPPVWRRLGSRPRAITVPLAFSGIGAE
jgi:hypothetical protein